MTPGLCYRLPTSEARKKLSEIIIHVQDLRSAVILTRHGKSAAAVAPMAELQRFWDQEKIEDIVKHGKRPNAFRFGPWSMGAGTQREAGEMIQKIQMDRLMEREVLQNAGLEPILGGEVAEEVPVGAGPKRRWRLWPFRKG